MKKIILFLLLVCLGYTDEIKTINVAYEDKATYPYTVGEGKEIDLKKPGLAIEAMKMIQKKLNIKFNSLC